MRFNGVAGINWYTIKRVVKFLWQRRVRGWDDSETWNLGYRIAEFTLPRLKRWKSLGFMSYPCDLTEKIWDSYIDEMIYAMESLGLDIGADEFDKIDWERVDNGFKLFGKYFRDLWD
jgi:hypothetical protein